MRTTQQKQKLTIIKIVKYIFIEDLPAKATALMVAILIWIYVDAVISITIQKKVPIIVEEESPDIIAQVATNEIMASFKGPKDIIDRLDNSSIVGEFKVNSSMLKKGETSKGLWLEPDKFVRTPSEVQFVGSIPEKIHVFIKKSMVRAMRIAPDIKDDLPLGFNIASITVTPSFIPVKGPVEVVKKASEINTEPIILSTIEKPGTLNLSVKVIKTIDGEPVSLDDRQKVMISIQILKEEKKETREFPVKISMVVPENFFDLIKPARVKSIKQSMKQIPLTGTAKALSAIKSAIQGYVDLAEIPPNEICEKKDKIEFLYTLNLQLPPGLTADVKEDKVVVEFTRD